MQADKALSPRAAAVRLLRRTSFHADPAAVTTIAAMPWTQAVDTVLTAPGTDAGVQATPPPAFTLGRKDAGADKQARRAALANEAKDLALWWVDRMAAAEHPWIEKRTWHWHDHWATSVQKVKLASLMYRQNDTLRSLGGGSFQAMTRAMVRDPALMIWLDATGSAKSSPNENLARELMEVFVLGVGNYSEQDVRQAALALTGWGLSPTDDPVFTEKRHEDGALSVLAHTGPLEDQSLADLLVAQPASGEFLVRWWWSRLVGAAEPSSEATGRLVAAYGTSYDSSAMLRALLLEPDFTDSASVVVRSPVEWLVGAMRALGVRLASLPAKQRPLLLRDLTGLGQVPFRPPNVGGWPLGDAWLTSAAAQARLTCARRLTAVADLSAVTSAKAAHRPEVIADRLGVLTWSDRTRDALADPAVGGKQAVDQVALALCAPEYVVDA